jgi:uncharacterized protein (TIGR02270 family)
MFIRKAAAISNIQVEHLSEISFLLTQRIALFHDPEVEWRRIGEFEERLLAHVDGIVEGGEDAAKVAIEWLTDGDTDNVSAAAYALSFTKGKDAMPAVVEAFKKADPAVVGAFVSALKFAENQAVVSHLLPLLTHEQPHIRVAVMEILGYRRAVSAAQVAKAFEDTDISVVKAAVVAARKLQDNSIVATRVNVLEKSDPGLQAECALTLGTLGNLAGLGKLQKIVADGSDPDAHAPEYLAIISNTDETDRIAQSPYGKMISGIQAFGICGTPTAVDRLIDLLGSDKDELRAAAGRALCLVTAAPLTEDHKEVTQWTDPDGNVVESDEAVIQRPSTSKADWTNWWRANKSRFRGGQRHREGEPLTTTSLLNELKAPVCVYSDRIRAYHEALVRRAPWHPFEPDWFVNRQQSTINGWRG